jgi:hypothetical protein
MLNPVRTNVEPGMYKGNLSTLSLNKYTYPHQTKWRLFDLRDLMQSDRVQPIFWFTLSYTTSCPRNETSVEIIFVSQQLARKGKRGFFFFFFTQTNQKTRDVILYSHDKFRLCWDISIRLYRSTLTRLFN